MLKFSFWTPRIFDGQLNLLFSGAQLATAIKILSLVPECISMYPTNMSNIWYLLIFLKVIPERYVIYTNLDKSTFFITNKTADDSYCSPSVRQFLPKQNQMQQFTKLILTTHFVNKLHNYKCQNTCDWCLQGIIHF